MHMARILILADIHANREALDAVVADAGACDAIWCLGDMIGYGPDPTYCLAWVREHCDRVLAGNHDVAAVEPAHLARFNPAASAAAAWTQAQLAPDDLDYLCSLPSLDTVSVAALPLADDDDDRTTWDADAEIVLAHGSPADAPEGAIWSYILTTVDALAAFDAPDFPGDLCFVGHSHVAAAYEHTGAGTFRIPGAADDVLDLNGARHIVNPGSVGQPRDRDPRAAYLLYDPRPHVNKVQWRRVAYDIEATQAKMHAADFPERLITRLAKGT